MPPSRMSKDQMSAPLSNLYKLKAPVGVWSNTTPVVRSRLHDRITRDIALSIIRWNIGKDPPPDLLTETDLSRNLQVSRTALRESVKVLAAKRLIDVRPKIGIRIKPREDWNILDPELLRWLCEAGMEDLLVRDLCAHVDRAGRGGASRQSGPRENRLRNSSASIATWKPVISTGTCTIPSTGSFM